MQIEKEFKLSALPLVCVCVPTYNAANTILETIKSILSQTYPNLIVHISDNASTDATLSVIESIVDSRIKIYRGAENIGSGNVMRCIDSAKGKYTAIFHADDVYEPSMVAKQVEFLEANADVGAVFTEASLINQMSKVVGEILIPQDIKSMNGIYNFPAVLKAVLRHSNFLVCPSAMVRTEIYQLDVKCWREDLFKSSADLDMWLRILKKYSIGCLPEKLMRYRISDHQFSAQVRLSTSRADFFLVADHYLKKSWVKALLSSIDWQNYRWLERRDRVMRAANLVIADQSRQAMLLLHDICSLDVLKAALKTKRGFFVLLLGLYLRILVFMGLHTLGKSSLMHMKQFLRK